MAGSVVCGLLSALFMWLGFEFLASLFGFIAFILFLVAGKLQSLIVVIIATIYEIWLFPKPVSMLGHFSYTGQSLGIAVVTYVIGLSVLVMGIALLAALYGRVSALFNNRRP